MTHGRINIRGRRRKSRRQARGLIMAERGHSFDTTHGWIFRVGVASGSPQWKQRSLAQRNPAYEAMEWTNDGGLLNAGTAEWKIPYSDFKTQLGGDARYRQVHTVHCRLGSGTNDPDKWGVSLGGVACGPSTTIFPALTTVLMGHGYGLWARFDAANAYVSITTHDPAGGSHTVEANSPAGTIVRPGDVMSLSYRVDTDTAPVTIEMIGMVNGVEVVSWSSNTGAEWDMDVAGGRPGMHGVSIPLHSSTAGAFGEIVSEWWVTNGYGAADYEEIPSSAPDNVGQVKVALMTNATIKPGGGEPEALWFFGTELRELTFGYKRIGGCATAKMRAVVDPWIDGTTTDKRRGVFQPFGQDWTAEDWMGGEFRIGVTYAVQGQPELLADAAVDETIWTGRIEDITFTDKTGEVEISAVGWWQALASLAIDNYQKDVSLKDALVEIVDTFAVRGGLTGTEFPLAGRDIVASGSILDQRQKFDFRSVSVQSAIETIMSVVPTTTGLGGAGMVWGVTTGQLLGQSSSRPYFYVRQALDHYDTGATASADVHFPTFSVDMATRFQRKVGLSHIVNDVVVYGAEDTEKDTATGVDRVRGRAECARSIRTYGRRAEYETDGDIEDEGLAARIAQAVCKREAPPRISVDLEVTEDLEDTTALHHAVVVDRPHLAILESSSPDDTPLKNIGETSPVDYKIRDDVLRRYGDITPYAKREDGSSNGKLTATATTQEQQLNKNWLLHVAVRFSQPHQGSDLSYATIIGRQETSGRGWGSLIWQNKTSSPKGPVFWSMQLSGSGAVDLDTGITMDPTTPPSAPANEIEFYIYRDSIGDFHIWSGGLQTKTYTAYRADDLTVHTDDWWLFDGKWWTPGFYGDVEDWWLYDLTGHPKLQSVAAVQAFINTHNKRRLRRNEGFGLIRIARLNESIASQAPIATTYWDEATEVWVADALSWDKTANSADAPTIVSNGGNARGWRLAEPTAGYGASNTASRKRWGGPLVLTMDSVQYRVDPLQGTVTATYRAGRSPDSFAASLAALERQADKTKEILARVKETL